MKVVSFQDFVKEVLRKAQYKRGKDSDCIVAIAPHLPGCMTQGDNIEEARDNLMDAIQLWITSALSDGEKIPAVNGCELIVSKQSRTRKRVVHA